MSATQAVEAPLRGPHTPTAATVEQWRVNWLEERLVQHGNFLYGSKTRKWIEHIEHCDTADEATGRADHLILEGGAVWAYAYPITVHPKEPPK